MRVSCVSPQAQDNTQRRADLDHVTRLDRADWIPYGLRCKNVKLPPHSSFEPPGQINCEASSDEDLSPRLSISLLN